jgi:hypothetical protein
MVDAERAADLRTSRCTCSEPPPGRPSLRQHAHNSPSYASANFETVAEDLYRMAGLGPADVGVVQSYENFTGGVFMALAEHRFFSPRSERLSHLENLIAPSGRLPLNTSGGNLAECYMHGFELVLEAVRQVRGTSSNQAARSDVALVIEGPMVAPVSNLLLGSGDVLEQRDDHAFFLPSAGPAHSGSRTDGVSAPYWNGLQQACCACSAAHTARPGSSGLNGSATPACNSTQPGSRCRPRD